MDIKELYKLYEQHPCITTDSRDCPEGSIFLALKGESFNGNKFALQALEKGCAYAIVDEASVLDNLDPLDSLAKRIILVDDALQTFKDLAREHRRQFDIPVIGITGTNGKTTTKELLAAVLSVKYNVHYTQGNFNNSLGVPLTLLQLTRRHDLAIVEMGASHPGDINELVEIACPDCGLITNVGRAHLEGFGSFEGVMQTKKELYDYLRQKGGIIFRNEDNPYLAQMATGMSYIGYHTGVMPEGMHLVGGYNAENVSAALCVGDHFGVNREEAMTALRAYVPNNNRSQAVQTKTNSLVVDAYNANPTSMQAAIQAFDGDTYILGAMRELGEYTRLEHQNIVNMLAERKAEKVLLVGTEWHDTTAPYPVYDHVDALIAHLKQQPLQDRHILIKGSHSVQLEKLLDVL